MKKKTKTQVKKQTAPKVKERAKTKTKTKKQTPAPKSKNETKKTTDEPQSERGGKQTVVDGEKLDNWTRSHVHSLIMGWGYKKGSFKVYRRCMEGDDSFVKLTGDDDDYYSVACYIVDGGGTAQIYVDHKNFVADETCDSDYDSEDAEGLNFSDSEDERGVGLDDGFEDIPQDKKTFEKNMALVLRTIGGSDSNFEHDAYESEELGSSDPDESDEERGVRYERYRKEHMHEGYKWKFELEFNSLKEFRDVVRDWSALKGLPVDWVKNESTRVRLKDIMQHMRTHFSLGITMSTAWKAKQYATEVIEGDSIRQYSLLRAYADELTRVSKGNTVVIGVERPMPTLPPRFGSFYFCFDGSKKGFIHGCRPFIGVDGCHLKTKYGGQLLIAVGRDPNDQYFPLAFGVVETETTESWRWFLQLLMDDIGKDNRFVFISDQQKGLMAVFEEMFDRVEHRLCLRHLYANFKKKFGGGTLIRDLMMGDAKATYFQAWEAKMNELKAIDKKAWDWLMAVDTKTWCKHAFSFYSKCDVLMNNLSESFNATILVGRDKPILTLCEWIRNYLMNRTSSSAKKLENWPHRIMPMPQRRLEKEVSMTGHWQATWVINEEFQIAHEYNGQQFIVNIGKKSCTCNFWDLVGIPCRHAVAAICLSGKNPIDFVDDCYSKEKYARCYGYAISAINGVDMWPKPADGVPQETLLPPMYKRGPGRPRKLRIRQFDENGVRKPRRGKKHCTKCGKPGHTVISCKSKTQDPDSLKRKRKPPKGKDQASGSGEKKPAAQAPSQSAAHVDVDQSQVSMVVDGTQPSVDASQNTQAASQNTQSATQPSVAASQPSDIALTQPSDLFDEIPDDVMASIPEIAEVLSTKPDEKKLKKVKIEKLKSAKEKTVKLYHGKKM
ncbi:hypothetical protein QL285_020024 [Trifolium repens]|nr:hypothetical protein QL285_020024 [Trifolium repens]